MTLENSDKSSIIVAALNSLQEKISNISSDIEGLREEMNEKFQEVHVRVNGMKAASQMAGRVRDPYFRIFSSPYSHNLNSVSEPDVEFRSQASFYDED